MLLDLGRNDVGRVAMLNKAGSNAPPTPSKGAHVRVTASFFVERYSHVMHLVSNVEGDAPEGLDPVDVLMAALPAGTLSGARRFGRWKSSTSWKSKSAASPMRALSAISALTAQSDTCIVLRTACFKDGMMYVQAGGGVVADSDPDAEYDETLHKARALRRAAEESWRFARARPLAAGLDYVTAFRGRDQQTGSSQGQGRHCSEGGG